MTILMRSGGYLLIAAATMAMIHATVLVAIACGPNPNISPGEVYTQTILMAGELVTGANR